METITWPGRELEPLTESEVQQTSPSPVGDRVDVKWREAGY